ncbi:sensor histidine kinase [Bacillus sp. FJAT-27445]|uniref:sensor histidine kinase n=1 Tax=Bacillus sp. FJAT-27445 TaxID=1679166 RepID=UPI000744177E|nr:sensor histidine kinase [Bacillus sp. FJAT-27445]
MKLAEFQRAILQISVLAVLTLAIYFVFVITKYPLIGLEVEQANGQWLVKQLYGKGWAADSGIEKGDAIYLVNEAPPDKHRSVTRFGRVEMARNITITDKANSRQTYLVSYQTMDERKAFYSFVPILFICMSLFLCLFLFMQKVDDESIFLLICFLLLLGISYLGSFVSARGDLIGRLSTTITFPGSLILFVHFMKSYFRRYNLELIGDREMKGIYLFYLLAMVLLSGSFFLPRLTSAMTIVKLVFFLFLLSCFLFLLSRFYSRYKNSEGKNILKILWFTLFLAFAPSVVFYVFPLIAFKKELVSAEITGLFILVIPLMFSYLLLAEKLFDIDFLLSRLRYYSILSLPFSFGVSLLLWKPLHLGLASREMVLIVLVFFSCSILFLYCKEFMDFKARDHLFSQRSNYEASLYTFFQKAKYETKVSSLLSNLAEEVRKVLRVKEVHILEIKPEKDDKWVLTKRGGLPDSIVEDIQGINWDVIRAGTLVEIHNGFCIIIGEHKKRKSVLFSGLKRYRTNLNVQEKIWLETIAYFSSILLENFQLIEDLFRRIEDYKEQARSNNETYPYWLSRLLFSLSEKERLNLSVDLHDSVLQDLLQLLREVELIRSKVPNPDIKNDLFVLKERMLDNIHMLRDTCNELRPPFLRELGIIQSIQNLIDQTKLRSNFILRTELDPLISGLDQERELALYRVVQELLNNAMKHSDAADVKLSLRKIGNCAILLYRDNGKGMDMKKLGDSFKTMGIAGIKERIRSLGGRVMITSSPGDGLSVQIEVDTRGEER